MKDAAGWSMVSLAAGLGAYACYLFKTKVSAGVAEALISLFLLH